MIWRVKNVSLRITIKTEGPLAVLGHDRVFDQPVMVSVHSDTVMIDGAQVAAEGDLRQSQVLGEISEKDRKEIQTRKEHEVLHTDVFPSFAFEGVYKEQARYVTGMLTLHGTVRPCRMPVTVLVRDGGFHIEGTTEIDLRPHGIEPYKAFLGALRVNTVVKVNYSLEIAS